MFSAQQAHFAHRHNRDGTHDSICFSCMRTIASAKDETKLEGIERVHLCDPVLLYQYNQGRSRANYSHLPVAS
jgi:hypothetical protein